MLRSASFVDEGIEDVELYRQNVCVDPLPCISSPTKACLAPRGQTLSEQLVKSLAVILNLRHLSRLAPHGQQGFIIRNPSSLRSLTQRHHSTRVRRRFHDAKEGKDPRPQIRAIDSAHRACFTCNASFDAPIGRNAGSASSWHLGRRPFHPTQSSLISTTSP